MTAQNLGVVVHAAGDLRVEPIAEPAAAEHEASVRVLFGGVCGSDLHYVRHGAAGDSVLREPLLLGHEVVGVVDTPARDGSGPGQGTLVVVHPATPGDDGVTPYPKDRPNLSPAGTYLGSAARYPHTQGAFAARVAVPARMLRPVPAGVAPERAALAEPASVAWHAVSLAGGIAGNRVLVIGAGPIGALIVAVLARAGAAEIIVSDLAEAPLAIAARLGATRTLRAPSIAAIEAVHADVVFEASGSVPGLENALRATRRGGTVVMVGLQRTGLIEVPMSLAITKELTLHGSFRFNDEIDSVLDAMGDGSLDVDPVVTHVFDVRDAQRAFEVASDPARSMKVLLRFTDDTGAGTST